MLPGYDDASCCLILCARPLICGPPVGELHSIQNNVLAG